MVEHADVTGENNVLNSPVQIYKHLSSELSGLMEDNTRRVIADSLVTDHEAYTVDVDRLVRSRFSARELFAWYDNNEPNQGENVQNHTALELKDQICRSLFQRLTHLMLVEIVREDTYKHRDKPNNDDPFHQTKQLIVESDPNSLDHLFSRDVLPDIEKYLFHFMADQTESLKVVYRRVLQGYRVSNSDEPREHGSREWRRVALQASWATTFLSLCFESRSTRTLPSSDWRTKLKQYEPLQMKMIRLYSDSTIEEYDKLNLSDKQNHIGLLQEFQKLPWWKVRNMLFERLLDSVHVCGPLVVRVIREPQAILAIESKRTPVHIDLTDETHKTDSDFPRKISKPLIRELILSGGISGISTREEERVQARKGLNRALDRELQSVEPDLLPYVFLSITELLDTSSASEDILGIITSRVLRQAASNDRDIEMFLKKFGITNMKSENPDEIHEYIENVKRQLRNPQLISFLRVYLEGVIISHNHH